MSNDTHGDHAVDDSVDDTAAHTPHTTRDTFRPHSVPDRFERRVRDDHAPNAALHSALAAMVEDDPTTSVNLMGSHAPGEKEHEPRYYVSVTFENGGMGEPSTGPTIIDTMVRRDDVKITKAFGGARYDDVTVHDDTGRGNDPTEDDIVDAVQSVVEQAVDGLTVHLRPVETRVEPIEVDVRDIPDKYVDINTVESNAARTLRKVVDTYGPESDRANEAARALATVLHTADPERYTEHVDDPEAAPRAAYRQLWRRAGVDPETNEVTQIRPTDDGGHEWEAVEDERTRDLADAIRDPDGRIVGGKPFPETRPPAAPLRSWVREHFDVDDPDDAARKIADAIEGYVVAGTVWGEDAVFTHDPDGATDEDVADAVEDDGTTSIPCGCGEYAVDVPEGDTPPAIDVVCPVCGNHFGHDTTGPEDDGGAE